MEHDEVSYWGSCPAEILITCFEYLAFTDLLACTGVNPNWRVNADYWGKKSGQWRKMFKNGVLNKGLNFIQRSNLDFRELYLNCRMWYSVHKAKVNLKHVYHLKGVQNIHVYRESLIAVCKNSVKFYNLDAGTLIKEILETYIDYQETDYMVAKFTQRQSQKHVSLYSKRNNETYESLGFGLCYIQKNRCYITNAKNAVEYFECTAKNFLLRTLGRYYSSPKLLGALNIYEREMYIYTSKGDVYRRKCGDLAINRICTLDVPNPPGALDIPTEIFMTMFHKCSVVYGVKSKEKEKMVRNVDINGEEHLVLLYADLTCAVAHDDVLLLGFKDGKVGFVLVKKLWTTNDHTPVFHFYIQEVAKVKDVEPVQRLEVYETDSCHHVIVATKKNVFQVVISHADYEKVMI